MTREDIKTIIDIVHKTIYGFFDVCDEEETPMTDKDKLLLKINKAICTNIRALEQEPKSEWQHDHEILKAHSDGANEMLDTIRAEIEERKLNSGGEPNRELAFNVCLQIIDKYKAESEIHCNCTDEEIVKSFTEDVEVVKDLLPREESEG